MTPESEIIDVEPIDETPTAEIVHQPIGQVSIYQSMDPAEQLREAQARAAILVQVIQAQGLSKRFGNSAKPHVFVEGWQFLASQFGLIPEIEWTKDLTDGWEARAVLKRMSDGQVVSAAEAECRTSEANWKGRPSYAVKSMAQTRAVSKVCRIALSSVMVMAGMSATPAEEMMDFGPTSSSPDPVAAPASIDEPHCPACLDNLGVLVAVTNHDRKPFWRCTADPLDCGGHRTYNGKDYSWSGWRTSWENSAAEWRSEIVKDDPKTVTISDTDRTQRSGYIVHEIMGVLGLVDRADAEALVKPGLVLAIDGGAVDATAALTGPISDNPTDDELRAVIANLTATEADAVVAASASLMPKAGRNGPKPKEKTND